MKTCVFRDCSDERIKITALKIIRSKPIEVRLFLLSHFIRAGQIVMSGVDVEYASPPFK